MVVRNATLLPLQRLKRLVKFRWGSQAFDRLLRAEVVEILRGEGCAVGADIVRIDQEFRPDAWSTWYRADADWEG